MLKDIPPGQYVVVVDRRGYFADPPEIPITVPPKGAVKDVVIRMIVGGVITGRVLDINGLGLAGATVEVGELSYAEDGKREMNSRGFTQTDDRGEYRVRGLRPGRYYVKGDVGVWASASETYYPGVKDMNGAVPLVVREAQDAIANFQIDPRLKPVMTISGRVTSSIAGVPADDVERIFVATPDGDSTYYDNRAEDPSNGRFEIRNIFPGVYDLFPEARDKDGQLFTSRTTVEVVDRSIENLALTASPLTETVGRLTLNGQPLAGRIKESAIRMETVRGLDPYLLEGPNNNIQTLLAMFEGGGVKADPDTGAFKIPPLPPGFYRVELNLAAPNVYVEDVRQGVTSVYTSGFYVGDPSGQPVEVMLASPGGIVSGAVRNAKQEPILGAAVVLIPDGPRRADRRRWLDTTAGPDGSFAITAIAPGTYKLFAWESLPAPGSAWFNEDFLRKYEARGQSVILDKGVALTVQLLALPKEPE